MGHGAGGRHSKPASIDAGTARDVAQTMQALATPSRVRILAQLREAPSSVNDLAKSIGMDALIKGADWAEAGRNSVDDVIPLPTEETSLIPEAAL